MGVTSGRPGPNADGKVGEFEDQLAEFPGDTRGGTAAVGYRGYRCGYHHDHDDDDDDHDDHDDDDDDDHDHDHDDDDHHDHHSSSFVIIRHHSSSFVIIRHHSSSFVIIRHHSSSFVIIRHHSSSFVIIINPKNHIMIFSVLDVSAIRSYTGSLQLAGALPSFTKNSTIASWQSQASSPNKKFTSPTNKALL